MFRLCYLLREREKYVYLMSRVPTAINSNYYILDFADCCPTVRQTSRFVAALLTFSTTSVSLLVF